MDSKSRIMELLRGIANENCFGNIEGIADYLLLNGVIALPCKIGDTLYRAVYIHKCDRCPNNHYTMCKYDGNDVECPRDIKYVKEEVCYSKHFKITADGEIKLKRGFYLTPEAAEEALRKERNNDIST